MLSPAIARMLALQRNAGNHAVTRSLMRTMGKGGKNMYWFTEGDAARACAQAWGQGRQFTLPLGGGLSVDFFAGQRMSAGQWVSTDTVYRNHVLHITVSIDKLELTRGAQGITAALKLSNPHATMRSQADSNWIGQNINAVLSAQAAKQPNATQQQLIAGYEQRQQRSLHAGTSKRWWSGNKANTEPAGQYLGLNAADLATGVGDMVINLKPQFAGMLEAAFGDHQDNRPVSYNDEKLVLAKGPGQVRWVGDAPPVQILPAIQPAPAMVPQPQVGLTMPPMVPAAQPTVAAPPDEEEDAAWDQVDEDELVKKAIAYSASEKHDS